MDPHQAPAVTHVIHSMVVSVLNVVRPPTSCDNHPRSVRQLLQLSQLNVKCATDNTMNITTDVVTWMWNVTIRWSEMSLMDRIGLITTLVKDPLIQFAWTDPIDSVRGEDSSIWMRLLTMGLAPFNFFWRWYLAGVVIVFVLWVIFCIIYNIVRMPYECLQTLGGMVHGKSPGKPISGKVVFPSPFPQWDNIYPDPVFRPRSLVELEMLRLMGAIKEKAGWYVKIENDEIVSKWKSEAKSQSSRLSDFCLNYCMDELKYEATSLRSASSSQPHIQASTVPGVYQTDDAIEPNLKAALIAGTTKLENVPEERKDYHPGTNRQVLNLIHPSMYCYRIGESPVTQNSIPLNETLTVMGQEPPPKSTRFIKVLQSILPTHPVDFYAKHDEYNISKQFQWLPSEFTVNDQNEMTIDSYINNLHPIHDQPLYHCLSGIFQRFIPLFERVLTDLTAPRENRTCAQYTPHPTHWGVRNGEWHTLTPEERAVTMEIPTTDAHGLNLPPAADPDARLRLFIRPFQPPQPITLKDNNSTNFQLKGRKLQVIVKLANIILTPDQPNYLGGSWHVEGMKNESIVASGIYYYHSENISESRLAFRTAVQEPGDYDQGDEEGVRRIYGLENGSHLNQPLGSVLTFTDRCIAFPNIYQHQVQPFHLTDPTKLGQRKILVFFLVDPGVRILSTANVPPQQLTWLPHSSPYHQLLLEQTNLIPPIIDLVLSYHCTDFGLIGRSQAEAVRLELMKERKYFVDTKNTRLFERDFSLCEH